MLPFVVGGVVALGGVTLFVWKRGHAPPSETIRADTPISDAAAPTDAGQLDANSDAAKPAAEPEESLSPECAALQRINEQTIRKFEERKNNCIVDRPDSLGCETTDNGVTWGYRIARIHGTPSKPADPAAPSDKKLFCETTTYDLELERRDRKGMMVASSGNETLSFEYYTKQKGISLMAMTDYDGDGEVEIYRVQYAWGHEGGHDERNTILTFKDGDVTPYPPAKGLTFFAPRDVDGDGRLDLLTSVPYEKIGKTVDAFVNSEEIVSALFVYHSLSDGTFALDDDAAIAYTRSMCPSRPSKIVPVTVDETTEESSNLADQFVCARLWGESSEKIVDAWNAVCKDFDGGEFAMACQEWPLRLAKIVPPFQLR